MVLKFPFHLQKVPVKIEPPQITLSFSLFAPPFTAFTKDLTGSLLKSFYFLKFKPFKVGDKIKIAGYEGHVDGIDLNYLRIVKKDKNIVYLPVSSILNSIIEIIK